VRNRQQRHRSGEHGLRRIPQHRLGSQSAILAGRITRRSEFDRPSEAVPATARTGVKSWIAGAS
jgi:hypothetical protein